MHAVENPKGEELKILPKSLGGHTFWTKSLVGFTILCAFIAFFTRFFFLFAWGSYVTLPYSVTTPVCLYVKERIKIFLSLKFFNALCDILQSLMSMT
jgi:hypothetical protein